MCWRAFYCIGHLVILLIILTSTDGQYLYLSLVNIECREYTKWQANITGAEQNDPYLVDHIYECILWAETYLLTTMAMTYPRGFNSALALIMACYHAPMRQL